MWTFEEQQHNMANYLFIIPQLIKWFIYGVIFNGTRINIMDKMSYAFQSKVSVLAFISKIKNRLVLGVLQRNICILSPLLVEKFWYLFTFEIGFDACQIRDVFSTSYENQINRIEFKVLNKLLGKTNKSPKSILVTLVKMYV